MRVAGIPGENISTLLYPSSQVIMTGVQCFVSGGSRQSISWDNLRWSVIPIVFTRHTHGLIDINVQIINTWRLGEDRKALQYFYFPLKWVLIKPKLRCQSQAGQLSTIIVPVRNIMSGLERMLEVAINDQAMLDNYFYFYFRAKYIFGRDILCRLAWDPISLEESGSWGSPASWSIVSLKW